MLPKRTDVVRAVAAAIATLALVAAVPQAALAEDRGIWGQWADEVADRATKAEIPFAVLFTLPAMIVITPFWWIQRAMDKMKGDD